MDNPQYYSKYLNGMVTPANHITEILLERKATKDGIKLVGKFWELPIWKRQYNLSVIQVSGLLNAYSAKSIIKALDRCKWAWSLTASAVKQAIIEEEEKLRKIEVRLESSEEVVVTQTNSDLPTSRPVFGKSNLSKLD